MTMHGVKIASRYVVQDGSNKPWLPATLTKMDKTFRKRAKFDRGFVMFCLSKSTQTSSKKGDAISCNVPVFQRLLDERRRVSIECAHEALEVEEVDPNDSSLQKKRKIKSSPRGSGEPSDLCQVPRGWRIRRARGRCTVGCEVMRLVTGANMKHIKQLIKSQADQALRKKKASPTKSPKRKIRRMVGHLSPLRRGAASSAHFGDTLVDSPQVGADTPETLQYAED